MSASPLVTISRTDESDVRQRQILVRLDDSPTRTLYFGDSFSQEIAAGAHTLRGHNTLFWKTVHFTVEPGERVEFVVVNRAGPMSLSFLALLGAAPLYLTIERRQQPV